MKRFVYILYFTFFSMAAQCQSGEITKIEFTTLTRGYQKQVFITSDSVIQITDGRAEDNNVVKRRLNSSDWNELMKVLEPVDLQELPSLQSPSSRRAFDGARHSSIKVVTKDGKEYEHAFDDEYPHQKLKNVMDVILKIEKTPDN
jgi:hypothetical protein